MQVEDNGRIYCPLNKNLCDKDCILRTGGLKANHFSCELLNALTNLAESNFENP